MITIKVGKLFCEYYNETYGTKYTPKEIFCDIIAPVSFKSEKNRHLINLNKSPFFYWNTGLSAEFKKYDINDFDSVLNIFCAKIESNGGLMDVNKVYGGSAVPFVQSKNGYDYNPQTTSFCYGENVYLTIDERYFSWIGSLFTMQTVGYSFVINQKRFVEIMWNSILSYRKALDNNTIIKKGNQIETWNTIYFTLYSEGRKNIDDTIVSNYIDEKGCIKSDITFLNILYSIYKVFPDIKYIDVENIGNTNTSVGTIFVNRFHGLKRQFDLVEKLFSNINENISYNSINNFTNKQSDLFYKIIEQGAIVDGLFDIRRDIDINKLVKNNYNLYIEYLKIVMTKEQKETVDKFVQDIKDIQSNTYLNIKFESFRNRLDFMEKLNKFKKKCGVTKDSFVQMVDYAINTSDVTDKDFEFMIKYFNFIYE